MKKKNKNLFEPSSLEQDIQNDFMAIISSTPSQDKVEHLMPKIRQIETKLKKRKAKTEIRRLMNE